MRNIVLARVDDRLIHGEVVSVWTPSLSVNCIIVIDDIVAKDMFNTRVLKALAPSGVKIEIYSVSDGVDALKAEGNSKERVMILTKTPIVFDKLHDQGVELKEVNLGGMGIRNERKPFIKNVACDDSEIESIRNLTNKGVHVYYQLVPEQKVIEVTSYI
ncbi:MULTISPECIES: PTS sugar transporter subunit IIB [Breznakia]|uniref:PTS system mannose-specific IIB component n=1 Tax=Breznakia blatticola TaxID=1754012 RepID=A0A4R8A4I5_9FIRM|nr:MULTISPECIES: PTS sugar transporter subunit IIB [Breznakia]MDH6368062.1 PTS system mannose-specific IIB component [Breznakia sp. PH1-1]MDH6405150.1 PTS system mannose-specific IIB component [Breznakia sp. PF1-11]MDH6412861.1 PTS system mannose-specific IIB component [Breznakia sp. PFB1-11]MDH6415226.1 PTS system mannose-specific IIB component [Breznakia sp. PFB1-14]MDH6417532.1 PTS system mannose-specific IIB component [Breznakia sp. PFB1-4]